MDTTANKQPRTRREFGLMGGRSTVRVREESRLLAFLRTANGKLTSLLRPAKVQVKVAQEQD